MNSEPYVNGYIRNSDGKQVPACLWQGRHARTQGSTAASAVLFGQPMSWGALYFANAWRRFLKHAAAMRTVPPLKLPAVRCPAWSRDCFQVTVNRWGASSWKKLMTLHMLANGLYMVYPNLPKRVSFSTNHVEPGVHVSRSALQGQRNRHNVDLVTRQWCQSARMACEANESSANAFELPTRQSIELYDFYCSRQPDGGEAGEAALREAGATLHDELLTPLGDAIPDEGVDETIVSPTRKMEL